MVSTKSTQDSTTPHPRPTDWQRGDDSVRITAVSPEVRRQILREHYEHRALMQHAVTIEAQTNRDSLATRFRSNPEAVRPYQVDEANRQLTAARTVEQDVKATLAVYSDNRDFRGVAK